MESKPGDSRQPLDSPTAERLLLDKIDRFLSGKDDFRSFVNGYYLFFVNEVPESTLDDDVYQFFADVHEKVDFTSEAPTTEERRYGWIGADEFKQWLKPRRLAFAASHDRGPAAS